ncbi:MAG: DUF1761 domain-containing protein [Pseudorhodoplanes sp.]
MTFAGINYAAVLAAAVAGWLTGAVWYGVFGKAWMAALGKTREECRRHEGTPRFYLPFVLALIAALVMAWILAGMIGHLGPGQVTVKNGMISAAFAWAGFVLTTIVVNNAFADRKAMLTAIDSGHWLAALLMMGAIIGAWGV